MNCQELLKIGYNELKNSNIDNPKLDSEIILCNILNVTRERLILNLEKTIKIDQIKKYKKNISERKNKKPVSYITKKKEFWKTNFYIDRNVLIPRPDTELLVEKSLEYLSYDSTKNILDIGTGSGCILISILLERKKCKGLGVDVSKYAINLAKINAKMQQLENRIKFINSDIDTLNYSKYDLIVSNPPYIKSFKLRNLQKDIRDYEPKIALDGGPTGCNEILKVIKKSSKILKKNGLLLIEIDSLLMFEVKKMLKEYNFYVDKIYKNLNGINRCIASIKN